MIRANPLRRAKNSYEDSRCPNTHPGSEAINQGFFIFQRIPPADALAVSSISVSAGAESEYRPQEFRNEGGGVDWQDL